MKLTLNRHEFILYVFNFLGVFFALLQIVILKLGHLISMPSPVLVHLRSHIFYVLLELDNFIFELILLFL